MLIVHGVRTRTHYVYCKREELSAVATVVIINSRASFPITFIQSVLVAQARSQHSFAHFGRMTEYNCDPIEYNCDHFECQGKVSPSATHRSAFAQMADLARTMSLHGSLQDE